MSHTSASQRNKVKINKMQRKIKFAFKIERNMPKQIYDDLNRYVYGSALGILSKQDPWYYNKRYLFEKMQKQVIETQTQLQFYKPREVDVEFDQISPTTLNFDNSLN